MKSSPRLCSLGSGEPKVVGKKIDLRRGSGEAKVVGKKIDLRRGSGEAKVAGKKIDLRRGSGEAKVARRETSGQESMARLARRRRAQNLGAPPARN
ncbi:MAG TPA: hypothetical protein VLL54_11385 [Pyrinomonadaceae bacterium]|nr:hypothetical protein [Pyrinomonadaceae bacterium]